MSADKINIAIFPGSFDPFTIGHESIVRRALSMFDKVVVGIGINTTKSSYFPIEKRVQWIQRVFRGHGGKGRSENFYRTYD